MSVTTVIGDAFGRWHASWTTTYPTDEQSNAAGERRHPLEDIIIRTRAVNLSDVLAKVRMLREIERGGTWPCKDEMLGSIAADLERLGAG